jgi:FixJ family two-component response regulator
MISRLHNSEGSIPFVPMSDVGVARLEIVAEALGTPYFLGKPFSTETLVEMMERALRRRVS